MFVTDNQITRELFRIYQCAAYNTACSVVTNTQDSLRYYNIFLFNEKEQKNDFIWSKIIDISNESLYTNSFNQEFDEYPQIKERFVSIRKKIQETDSQNQKYLSARYLQSQTVFDSSLSQDITKMDLSYSTVRTTSDVATMSSTIDTAAKTGAIISLEELPINNHECMSMLCGVIKHMITNGISPISQNPDVKSKQSVQWVESIATTIGNTMKHKNIRIFLVKLVLNCAKEFYHYGGILIQPLLKFLIDKCGDNNLNYFNMDVIALIIEWTTNESCKLKTFEEKSLATATIKFAMEHSWHLRREIFRHNLEMIKLMIETWSRNDTDICIPKQFLFASINRSRDPASRDNIHGLQLNGIILANNLLPWIDQDSAEKFIRSLYLCMSNDNAVVYQPAAHLIGMCLEKIQNSNENICEMTLYTDLINILSKYRQEKEEKFTKIIYAIHKNFPQICDAFFILISKNIVLSAGVVRKNYLEMFLSRMDTYGTDIYRELLAMGIRDLLKQHEFQQYALHIINKSLPYMSNNELSSICDDVLQFVTSKKRDCRDIMYEILMFIQQKPLHTINSENAQNVTVALLNGLNDSDEEIQKRLLHFWTNEKRLSSKLDERLLQLFDKLYEPNSERYFLSYCVQLLMEPAIQNPDSKRQIFAHHTDTSIEMKLTEYDINVNWKTQNSSFQSPLFVESQQRQMFFGDNAELSSAMFDTNWLRKSCANLAFEPTQDPVSMSQTCNSFSLQSQSSMMFSVQPQMLDRRSKRITNESSTTYAASAAINNFERLRPRFLRDKEAMNKNNALRAVERNAYKTVIQSQTKEKRERDVKLYRRYRIGDYPDLLINSLALLLPLAGLAKYDNILARQIIVAIFASIKSELIDLNSDFVAKSSTYIQAIITKSKFCEPLVFATLMEIALSDSKSFNLPPGKI